MRCQGSVCPLIPPPTLRSWYLQLLWVKSEVQKHPAEFALSFKCAHKTLNRVQVQYRPYKRLNRWHTASIKCIPAAWTFQMMSQHHPKEVMGPFFTDSFSLLHQDQHNRFILGKHRKQTRPTTRLNQTPASKSSNLSLCFPPYHAPHYFYFALFVLSPRLKVGRAAEELSEGGRLERSLWGFEDGLISLSSVSQFVISPHSTATARDQASFRLHQKVTPGSSEWHLRTCFQQREVHTAHEQD